MFIWDFVAKKDCHDHLPEELLLSWTPEQREDILEPTAGRILWEKRGCRDLLCARNGRQQGMPKRLAGKR